MVYTWSCRLDEGVRSLRRAPLLVTLVILVVGVACGQTEGASAPKSSPAAPSPAGPVLPKGDRLLGFDLNEASDGDFDRAFRLAQDAGMQRVGFSPTWAMIETGPQTYDSTWLDIAAAYYPAHGVTIDLTVMVVNANRKEFPADLMGLAFDDPLVIQRFQELLDFIFARLPVSTLGSRMMARPLETASMPV